MSELENRLADSADTLDAAIEVRLARPGAPTRGQLRGPSRRVVTTAAVIVLVVGAAVPLVKIVSDSDDSSPGAVGADSSTTTTTSLAPAPPTISSTIAPTTVPAVGEPTHISGPLAFGSSSSDVTTVQQRLTDLGFFVGPVDGEFGNLTQMAVWAFEKLVMQVPRDDATGVVTDEMWQFMQQPMQIQPRRRNTAGESTPNHTEVYLPEQVVVFYQNDQPVLISHMSSGTGAEWKEEVTIDIGEYGNEDGTAPIVRGEIGVSVTPGGVYSFDRMIEGVRQSALGGMWNPAYFNYGIAIHGALNVPLEPASHGCIRVPMKVGELFHQFVAIGDQVFVWDGVKEPEVYGDQLPIFNRIDPDYVAPTTTTAPTSTTLTVANTTG